MRRQMRFEQLEGGLRRIGTGQEIDVPVADGAPFRQRFQVQNRIPVFAAVQNDLNLLRQLLCLHQGEDLEHLIKRSETAWKDDQRLCQVRKPEFAHEEIVKLEVEAVGDVRVWPLLVREADVQADR